MSYSFLLLLEKYPSAGAKRSGYDPLARRLRIPTPRIAGWPDSGEVSEDDRATGSISRSDGSISGGAGSSEPILIGGDGMSSYYTSYHWQPKFKLKLIS